MIFEEMLREEKMEGKQEGSLEAKKEFILELLEELGDIPEKMRDEIESLREPEQLKALHKMAAKADSIGTFVEKAKIYLRSEEK